MRQMPNNDVPQSPAGWRGFLTTFWPLLAVFFALRVAGGLDLPVMNDEPLYVDYMQKLRDDFRGNQWISFSGGYDWKPPLQYWAGSLFVGWFENPLAGARLATLLVALAGFAFGLKLVRDATGSPAFAAIFGAIWAVNPWSLVMDQLVMSESWVVALGFIYFYYIHIVCAAYLDGRRRELAWPLLKAALAGALLLLVKQAGEPYLVYALAIAPAMFLRPAGARLKDGAAMAGLSAVSAAGAWLIYFLELPAWALAWKKSAPMNRHVLFSLREMAEFPAEVWLSNVYTALVKTPIAGFGHWFCAVAAVACVAACGSARGRKALAYCTALLLAVNIVPALAMKAPGARHLAANSFFAWLLLAAAGFYMLRERIALVRPSSAFARHLPALALIAALPFQVSGLRYFTVSEWDWQAVTGDAYEIKKCLKAKDCQWYTPVNVTLAVEHLAEEDRRGNGGILYLDPQWGHPRGYVWMMRHRFPHIKTGGFVLEGMFDDMPNVLADAKRRGAGNVYFLYNGLRARPPSEVGGGVNKLRAFYEKGDCPNPTVIDQGSTQSNIFICRFPADTRGTDPNLWLSGS